MRRLVFVVSNGAVVNVGYLVKRELLVKLKTGVSSGTIQMIVRTQRLVFIPHSAFRTPHFSAVELLHSFISRLVVFMRHITPGKTTCDILQTRVYQRRPTTTLERGVKIPAGMHLVVD